MGMVKAIPLSIMNNYRIVFSLTLIAFSIFARCHAEDIHQKGNVHLSGAIVNNACDIVIKDGATIVKQATDVRSIDMIMENCVSRTGAATVADYAIKVEQGWEIQQPSVKKQRINKIAIEYLFDIVSNSNDKRLKLTAEYY
jgi:hypothetical protein